MKEFEVIDINEIKKLIGLNYPVQHYIDGYSTIPTVKIIQYGVEDFNYLDINLMNKIEFIFEEWFCMDKKNIYEYIICFEKDESIQNIEPGKCIEMERHFDRIIEKSIRKKVIGDQFERLKKLCCSVIINNSYTEFPYYFRNKKGDFSLCFQKYYDVCTYGSNNTNKIFFDDRLYPYKEIDDISEELAHYKASIRREPLERDPSYNDLGIICSFLQHILDKLGGN